jgi:hypothetical protein
LHGSADTSDIGVGSTDTKGGELVKLLRDDTMFQRLWNRNFLTIFLPGFLLFGVGGIANLKPVIVAGWATAAFGLFRSWRLIVKFRRCPDCRRVNYTRLGDDDTCIRCGTELPLDGPG